MHADLYKVVKQIMTPKKGILASDESDNTANKSLSKAGIAQTDENRRKYREIFINTPQLNNYLSGIILNEETLSQKDITGMPLVETLKANGILVGVKVDQGTQKITEATEEVITKGLDTLHARLTSDLAYNVSFTKWRAVIRIGEGIPTEYCIKENATRLSQYAQIVIAKGLVPILEPEVLLNGTHSIDTCKQVMILTLSSLFSQLKQDKVDLKAIILKTSMCLPGDNSGNSADALTVANYTVDALKASVPAEIGGIVFLSGGQEAREATQNLNEIAKLEPLPWELAFSFSRSIEAPALAVWQGKDENIEQARTEFLKVLAQNSLADQGLLTN